MGRFSAWFSQLSRSAIGAPSASNPDEVDTYFFALRIGSVGAALLWVWRLAAPGMTVRGIALVLAFTVYSTLLYAEVWRHPEHRARAYVTVLPADLIALFLVCLWSAEPLSGVYLGFYLLIALHSFYFGAWVGVAAAASFASLYVALCLSVPAAQRCPLEELIVRLGFGFFVAVSLSFVSRQLRAGRLHLAEVNRQLEHRNRILEQTYRHLSVGRLAGDVAHHINNPAAIIIGKAEVIRRRAQRDELPAAYAEDLGTIAEAAFRIGGVARSLLALSPRHDGTPRTIDLAAIAQGVILLFESRVAERCIHLHSELRPGLRVFGHESALRQVIVNLLCNAFDAVERGGHVDVDARVGAEPGTVELCVRDDGHGIAREHLDEVFSPFFTTKDATDGVGLGLSQSLTFVRRLGGTLRVESGRGSGSAFIVALPIDSGPAAHEDAA